jgi:Na+-driven multidrug efflux pump
MQFLHLGIMLCVGLELGLGALIGQNLGAGKIDRAWETAKRGLVLGTGAMVLLGILTIIFARTLIGIFFSSGVEVELGVVFYRIMAVSLPFIGAYIIYEGIFTGSGDTVPLMGVGVVYMWAVQVPGVFLTTRVFDFGLPGVWWSFTAASIIGAAVFHIMFLRRKWLKRKV